MHNFIFDYEETHDDGIFYFFKCDKCSCVVGFSTNPEYSPYVTTKIVPDNIDLYTDPCTG